MAGTTSKFRPCSKLGKDDRNTRESTITFISETSSGYYPWRFCGGGDSSSPGDSRVYCSKEEFLGILDGYITLNYQCHISFLSNKSSEGILFFPHCREISLFLDRVGIIQEINF